MTTIKMNNKVRRVVATVIILIGIMMTIGTAAHAANEEGPKDLINGLVEAGFIYDEYEEVWMFIEYEFYGEGEYSYIQAWYDIENNIGNVLSLEYNKFGIVSGAGSGTFRWNDVTREMDEMICFEWSV